jgi:hypothetical protein
MALDHLSFRAHEWSFKGVVDQHLRRHMLLIDGPGNHCFIQLLPTLLTLREMLSHALLLSGFDRAIQKPR